MSYKKKNTNLDNIDKDYEIEIMKVKVEQLEKRLDLLEKNLLLTDRLHRAEMMTLFNKNKDSSSSSESDTPSDVDEKEIEDLESSKELEELKSKSISKKNGGINDYMRRVG
jgi:hypothetical protein